MDRHWTELKAMLTHSVEKNGEKPLTNKWLLNMMNLVDRKIAYKDSLKDLVYYDEFWKD